MLTSVPEEILSSIQKIMKKFYLLSSFFLASVVSIAQSVAIVSGAGGAAGTSGNIIIGQSSYHVSESIYTENEIGAGNFTSASSAINEIGYFVAQVGAPTQISSFKIWMQNISTTTTEFAAGTYSTAGYTLVFDGTIEPAQTGEYKILLNTPFVRTPGTNLQVMVERLDGVANAGYIFYSANGNDVSETALTSRRVNQAAAPTAATNLTTSAYRPAIDLIHLYNNDASVIDIVNPTISCYGSDQTIGVVVSNEGLNSIPAGAVSVTLNISGANAFSASTSNNAEIAPGATEVVNFTGINLNNPGQNFDTILVSYSSDQNVVNDSLFANTNTSEVLSTFPIVEDAEATPLSVVSYTEPITGGSSAWTLIEGPYSNGTATPDSLRPREPGTTFYLFDSYNALEGVESRLYSKCIDLPAGSPSIKSTFWMSHDSVYAAYQDSMYVSISTDKGLSWTRLKGLGRVDANATAFYWAQDSVDLTAYAGQTVQLAFEGVSYYGNSFGLDDININACPTTGFNATTADACYTYSWAANGQTYTQSGTYTYTYTGSAGCPATDTLYLTISQPVRDTTITSSCFSYVWSLNNQTYTQSGTYTFEESVPGQPCPIIHTLILQILGTNNAQTATACDTYTWSANNETYTTSGVYLYNNTTGGCNSIDTLYLTINNSTVSTTNETSCDSFTWNGVTYTESGSYIYTSTNSAGCDSTATLVLTINITPRDTTTISQCDAYVWPINNETYTQSGTYSFEETVPGQPCPTFHTLVLEILTTNNVQTDIACDSYTWAATGETYTTSGDYTYSYTNTSGCASVDTLHLTINYPTFNAQTETACDSYVWNGTTYTESGDYTYSYSNNGGCASVDTLHLTLNSSTHNVIDSTSETPVTWNGTTYSSTGTYVYNYTNSNGCPSSDTLHLTIFVPVVNNSFAYPNPSNGKFWVRFDNNSNTNNPRARFVTVYDSKGNRLFSKEVGVVTPAGEIEVDMSNYSKGIYHIELGDFSGKRITSGKVIIQ